MYHFFITGKKTLHQIRIFQSISLTIRNSRQNCSILCFSFNPMLKKEREVVKKYLFCNPKCGLCNYVDKSTIMMDIVDMSSQIRINMTLIRSSSIRH